MLNKKGIFLPLFVFSSIVILGVLFYVMNTTEAKKEDFVGLKAVNIIKTYDEAEKINLYLDLAAKYSYENTLKNMAENGGYSSEAKCEKTQPNLIDQEPYVIWNTCPVLNPDKEFELQFKKEIKDYINKYESSYIGLNYGELNLKSPGISHNDIFTKALQDTNLLNIENSENNLIVTFSDIDLQIENTESSKITIKPKTKTQKPDIRIYEELYTLVKNYCIKKEFEECQGKLSKIFSNIELKKESEIIKLKLLKENYSIKIAFNTDYEIPGFENILLS